MGILVKDSGIWKDSEPYVKDAGIWKPVDTGYVKDAGVWKEMYSSGWVLEGSWETGLEGWTLFNGTGTAGASRSEIRPRTGAWTVGLQRTLTAPEPYPHIEYIVPIDLAAPYIRLSVYIEGPSERRIEAKVGSGSFSTLSTGTSYGASVYTLLSASVANPSLQTVRFRVRQTGTTGINAQRLDDWKIEGSSNPFS